MRYNPEDANNLIPDGEYDAEIAVAVEKVSKSGKDMMELKVKVWPGSGGDRVVFDYIVVPTGIYKLKQIAAATGQTAEFERGELGAEGVRGKSVRVQLKTQKDKTGDFPDKNVIARYLPPAAGASHSSGSAPADDDGIPF